MKRYLSSFFITFSIYAILILSVVYILELKDDSSDTKIVKNSERLIKFTLLSSASRHSIVNEKNVKKVVKKVVKKIEPKIIKKKLAKVKKIVKKVAPKPAVTKVEKKEEKIVKKSSTKKLKTLKSKNSDTVVATSRSKNILNEKKRLFLTSLREKINKNKHYPRRARDRGIEGEVKVNFVVLADGKVSNVLLSSRYNILKKSVSKAIYKSFPLVVPKELNIFPLNVSLQLEFKLS
ncbi:MAG: TonB family protein [Helicobacteraceae bacterium]|nr:TonB family protein [Helicobacteraceae bacterium]